MKYAQNLIYTAQIAMLFLLIGAGSGSSQAGDETLLSYVAAIVAIWCFMFFLGSILGVGAPQSLTFRNLKNEELSKLQSWKRFMAQLMNLLSLVVWYSGSHLGFITDYGAYCITMMAGVVTGYASGQQLRRLLVSFERWADRRWPPKSIEGFDRLSLDDVHVLPGPDESVLQRLRSPGPEAS